VAEMPQKCGSGDSPAVMEVTSYPNISGEGSRPGRSGQWHTNTSRHGGQKRQIRLRGNL
jgi:hypothetical protein